MMYLKIARKITKKLTEITVIEQKLKKLTIHIWKSMKILTFKRSFSDFRLKAVEEFLIWIQTVFSSHTVFHFEWKRDIACKGPFHTGKPSSVYVQLSLRLFLRMFNGLSKWFDCIDVINGKKYTNFWSMELRDKIFSTFRTDKEWMNFNRKLFQFI